MKKSNLILFLLLFFISTGVYAEQKTSLGATISTLDFSILLDVPTSHKSSVRLEAGIIPITKSSTLGIKYRSLFGGGESRYYWEVGVLNVGPGKFINFFDFSGGTSTLISLGARSSKRASGRWFAEVMFVSGPGGLGVGPRFGYEFAP